MKAFLTAALLLGAVPARADPSNGLPTEFRPSFPVFGSGPVVNFLNGDNQALTNASAHVAWSLAVPAVGQMLWGRKGLWISGLSWIALTVVQESLFHAPSQPGPGYPAEVRSDLITRLVPCAALLVVDALRGGRRAAARPDVPPEGLRELPAISLDSLSVPPDGSRPAVKLGPLSSALRVAGTIGTPEPGDAFAARSGSDSCFAIFGTCAGGSAGSGVRSPQLRAEPRSSGAGEEPQPSVPSSIAVPSESQEEAPTPTM